MRSFNQIDEVGTRAETLIDVEEVLDAIAMISVEVATLLEYRAQPERGHPETCEVIQLTTEAAKRAALPAVAA